MGSSGGCGSRGGGRRRRGRGPKKMDECRQSGKRGYWAWECRSKPKEQGNMARDEEAFLMVARVTISQYPTDE
jgi:hypothetical protein